MRKLITLIAITISLTSFGQNDYTKDLTISPGLLSFSMLKNDTPILKIDTVSVKFIRYEGNVYSTKNLFKKDTVAIPVYIIQKTDTAKQASEMVVEFKKGRLYRIKGYYIYIQQLATTDGKTYRPIGNPAIIGAIDEKKKPVNLFRQ